MWIPAERAERARNAGYTVVDAVSVLGTHLAELIRRYAHELFSRQDAKRLLDRVAVENPKVVEDLVPKLLPLATVQRVLQNLLRERVSIRDAVSILEALGEAAAVHAQSGAADRVRAPGHAAGGGQAVSEPRRRPAGLVPRSLHRANRGERPWSTASRTAISTLAPQTGRDILNRLAEPGMPRRRRRWSRSRPPEPATSCGR